MPSADRVEPKRRNCRSNIDDPNATMSGTSDGKSNRVRLKAEGVEPNRETACNDGDKPD